MQRSKHRHTYKTSIRFIPYHHLSTTVQNLLQCCTSCYDPIPNKLCTIMAAPAAKIWTSVAAGTPHAPGPSAQTPPSFSAFSLSRTTASLPPKVPAHNTCPRMKPCPQSAIAADKNTTSNTPRAPATKHLQKHPMEPSSDKMVHVPTPRAHNAFAMCAAVHTCSNHWPIKGPAHKHAVWCMCSACGMPCASHCTQLCSSSRRLVKPSTQYVKSITFFSTLVLRRLK